MPEVIRVRYEKGFLKPPEPPVLREDEGLPARIINTREHTKKPKI